MVRITGTCERTSTAGETVDTFVPAPLPTSDPPLDMDAELSELLNRSEAAIARLQLAGTMVPSPLLYLSLYFKRRRAGYYKRLNAVRAEGDFESWPKYFLEGIAVIADETVETTQRIFARTNADRAKVLSARSTSVSGIRLFELLPAHPIINVAEAVRLLKTTKSTATKAVSGLVDAGILVETAGRRGDSAYSYRAYLNLLRAGTESI